MNCRHPSLLRLAFVLRSDNLRARVTSGAKYQFAGIVLRTALTLASTAILARLLTPADFGYIAMATVVTEFAALFSNFGFNALLIQRRVMTRWQVDTVFWASLALGAILSVAVIVASFLAQRLFADARVGELLRVMCLSFLLSSLATIPGVVLSRLMRFDLEFWVNITSVVLRIGVSICFAYTGFGVWSLVAGALAGAASQVILSFLVVPYRPRLRFHVSYLAGSWRTSTSYFGGGLLFFTNMNFDLLVIGRQLGATPLGYYQNARSLTDEIRARIAVPLQHVLFPAFSSVQLERERLQQMVIKSARILAAVVMPLGAGVSAVAAELVPTLYGAQWLAMVPVMNMLGLSAALKASTAVATPIFNAANRVGLSFRYNLISTAMVIGGVWLATPYGISAVSMTIALISVYSVVPFVVAFRLIGLRTRQAAWVLLPPAAAALASWLAVWAARPVISMVWSTDAANLCALVTLGAATYLVVLLAISRQYLLDFGPLLSRFWRPT